MYQPKEKIEHFWEANGVQYCEICYWIGVGYQRVKYRLVNGIWQAF